LKALFGDQLININLPLRKTDINVNPPETNKKKCAQTQFNRQTASVKKTW